MFHCCVVDYFFDGHMNVHIMLTNMGDLKLMHHFLCCYVLICDLELGEMKLNPIIHT